MNENEEVYVTEEVSPSESYLYQLTAIEGAPDEEKVEEHLNRRADLLARMNESDKAHIAMVAYNKECSQKTRDLVRQRRREREYNEARLRGVAKSVEVRRKAPKEPEGEERYKAQLAEVYDEPKLKLRKKKVPVVPEAPSVGTLTKVQDPPETPEPPLPLELANTPVTLEETKEVV